MKKFLGIVVVLVLVALGGFLGVKSFSPGSPEESGSHSAATDDAEPNEDPVRDQLSSMTLEQKVAQMLIVKRSAGALASSEQSLLETTPYGGYILMGDAYATLAETRGMVEELQSFARVPLIITTDQEGGAVQRLQSVRDLAPTDIPDMYSVGETGNTSYAQTIGRVLAEELRVIGINVDLAPDADVFSDPNNTVIGRRSFSENPQTVATMSAALAKGLEDNGVVATFKHFPGHGDTATDSHQALPIINRSREDLDNSDLVPFRNAIKYGAELIMVGHIAMPQITGDNTPATLSPTITTDLLRNELGYQNLIITDGLDMKALTDNYSEEDIYTRAVLAGADLLLLPPDPTLAIETIKRSIPEQRIDESVYRILKFKQEKLSNYEYLDYSYFGSAEHAAAI